MDGAVMGALVLSEAGWALVATLICIAGVAVIANSGEIPIPFIGTIARVIGWGLIMIGGYIGVYGLYGEQVATRFFAVAFLIIWIVGVIIIILYQIGILRKREEAYGGE